jgi:FdhD protein
MDGAATRAVPCRRYRDGRFADITDVVALEIAVTVCLDGGRPRRLFASPLDPEALALGHAALELTPPGQVPNRVRADGLRFDLTSRPDPALPADPSLPRALPAGELLALMRRFIGEPGLWDGTGCFHRAALYDTVAGEFVARAEDIGRHNCLDRLAGEGVRHGIRLAELLLFLSCRVTASMLDKAARAGSRCLVSRSAVTDAAIAAARQAGITLIGFAREAEERLTVFVDPAGRVAP